MLLPRKNPLIDQPLVATATGTLRRSMLTIRLTLAAAVLISCTLAWSVYKGDDAIYTWAWWRGTIYSLISQQFQNTISHAKDSRLSERLKSMESERNELQSRLHKLENLMQTAKIGGWFRHIAVTRVSDEEISYEILISNTDTVENAKSSQTGNIQITVRGVDKLDPIAPEAAIAQSALRFKNVQHEIPAPQVSEAVQGKISSRAAKFLIVSVVPFDNPALAEVRIVPVGNPSRSL